MTEAETERMTVRTASCTCGQLKIEVSGDPLGVGICHGLACRRHGWVRLPRGVEIHDKDPD